MWHSERIKASFRIKLTQVQESRAVARKPRDAAAVLFGLKFADNIHYKFKSSQASKARLESSKHTGAKQNLTQNGHSRSLKQGHVLLQLVERATRTLIA